MIIVWSEMCSEHSVYSGSLGHDVLLRKADSVF